MPIAENRMSLSHRLLPWSLAAVALAASACASTGYAPRPFPSPAGSRPAAAPLAGEDAGYEVVTTALALRGIPYLNGGSDPGGFDCSGFTQYVFARHGMGLPREVRDQFALGRKVNADELDPGDLLFFETAGSGASHVAIAVGDGDQFVHAPSSAGVVRVERLSSSYWSRRFVGARRLW
jgi:cell wall-associated NlpC family hydrolase